MSGPSTLVTAVWAIAMPVPLLRGMSLLIAEVSSAVVTCVLVAEGLADLMSAAMAATVGAAAEVPQKRSKSGVEVAPQSAAMMSAFGSAVPPLVPNSTLPGV